LGAQLATSGATLPKIFCVNWFRKDEQGRFVWPGFGENMRVLKWMVDRIEGQVQGSEHVFGVSPRYEELSWDGLDFTAEQFAKVISLDAAAWQQELALHDELFTQLAHHLPQALPEAKARLEGRLQG
jgi:phosphoenolpyruvate carboxykinase (GTP)